LEEKEKQIKEELNEYANIKKNMSSSGNELLQFFVGVILLGVGLFLLCNKVVVHSSWYSWRLWGMNLSSGLVIIPLIIGIIWLFYNPKSIAAKIIIVLGAIFIVATIIMSVSIHFVTTSMFEYILIIGMCAAGSGLLLKTLFKKRN